MGDGASDACCEGFLGGVVQMILVAEEQHLVAVEGGVERQQGFVRQVRRQPYAGDLGADTAADRADVQAKVSVQGSIGAHGISFA